MSGVAVNQELERHLAVFRRGAVDLIEEPGLRAALERALGAGRGLRIKFGMDPSSPDLHLGHAVQLLKLRALQQLGHTIVLIVGDSTARVGDPSGRNKLRPQLSADDVEHNLRTYTAQSEGVLDMERTEVRRNSEWFDAMAFQDVLRLAGRMTVARMIERDTFQKRMADAEPIGIHEFLYPLMQGWDSVQVRADVELGGTDQLFNLLVGRSLQEQEGQAPQVCLTMPLINGLDGRKMSKSYGNAIGLTDTAEEMFGKVMSLGDDVLGTWFELLTDLPPERVAELVGGHPRDAKAELARTITAFHRGAEAAARASAEFDRRFRDRQLPEEIPEVSWSEDWPAEGVPLPIVLRELGLAKSSSEARRLIQQGGVRLGGEVQRDPATLLERERLPLVIQVGKKHVRRLQLPA